MTQLKILHVFFNVVDQVTLLLYVEDTIVSTFFIYINKENLSWQDRSQSNITHNSYRRLPVLTFQATVLYIFYHTRSSSLPHKITCNIYCISSTKTPSESMHCVLYAHSNEILIMYICICFMFGYDRKWKTQCVAHVGSLSKQWDHEINYIDCSSHKAITKIDLGFHIHFCSSVFSGNYYRTVLNIVI